MRRVTPICIRVLLLLCFLLAACEDEDGGPTTSTNGTGVPGLDTPEEILSNPYVEDALEEAERRNVYITPEKGLDPPVISGRYAMTGEIYLPVFGWQSLTPGTWRWSNQTSTHKIDTEYSQVFGEGDSQTGSGGGEIIRGRDRYFTVYSVIEVDDTDAGGCKERFLAIIDGTQLASGDVSARYIATPAQEPVCHVRTIGRMELDLTGAVSSVDGAARFISILTDSLRASLSNSQTGE